MSKSTGYSVVCVLSNSESANRTGGFTLLEVLVAFAILAVALAAIFQAFSQGIHGSHVAEERAHAVMLARSKLAEVGVLVPLVEGEQSGDFADGFKWQLTIAPIDSSELNVGNNTGTQMFDVALSIEHDDRELIKLHSLRLGALP